MASHLFTSPDLACPRTRRNGQHLTEADAVDIWVARWLKVRTKDLVLRYGCDPRRLYEIWEGTRFPRSRKLALEVLDRQYPGLSAQIDVSRHRRIPVRSRAPEQLALFD